jgi:hypothetical protein
VKNTGPLSTYNRVLCRHWTKGTTQLGQSLLGYFGADEAHLLADFVRWSDADGTTYDAS